MPGKDTIFSSKVKYNGVFNRFLHETQIGNLAEDEYQEKITGPVKEIKIVWTGSRKFTDYFKFNIKVEFHIIALAEVELNQGGAKIKTNKGDMKISVKGELEKDYQGRYDPTAFKQFLRGVYEKFIIQSRVKEFEDKVAGYCDDFLGQAKAWLDIEGRY